MSEQTLTVTLRDVPVNAATDALLAIESFAARMYSSRSNDAEEQQRYNDLASIVLPLREARDEALCPCGGQGSGWCNCGHGHPSHVKAECVECTS